MFKFNFVFRTELRKRFSIIVTMKCQKICFSAIKFNENRINETEKCEERVGRYL